MIPVGVGPDVSLPPPFHRPAGEANDLAGGMIGRLEELGGGMVETAS